MACPPCLPCSGGGSVVLYSDPHGKGAASMVPLQASSDASARLCLSLAAAGDASLAAGSAAGSVTVWDVPTQRVREHYAHQHAGGAVAAVAFAPLRPGLLYSAGADGRLCMQDRTAGPDHAAALAVGAPATALMVKEDLSLVGVGTAGEPDIFCSSALAPVLPAVLSPSTPGADSWLLLKRASLPCSPPATDGVVQLYDPRHMRQPLHALPLEPGAPITSLHWQHRYASLGGSRHRASSSTAAAAPGRGAHQPAGPSRLGQAPASSAAAGAAAPPAAAAAPSAAVAAPPAEPAGNAAAISAAAAAAAGAYGGAAASGPAAALRTRLAADMLRLAPRSAARSQSAGAPAAIRHPSPACPAVAGAAAGGQSASAPASRAASVAEVQPRSASQQATPMQAPAAAPAPSPRPAVGSSSALPQVTPLAQPPAAGPGLGITPLPGMASRFDGAAAAPAEMTPVAQQQPGADAAGEAAQHMQQLTITPLAGGQPPAAAPASQHEAVPAVTPMGAPAAAPVNLNITPLVGRPARQPAAAASLLPPASSAAAQPPRLDVTPLAAPAGGKRAQLCISPLPGMQPSGPPGSASPQARSVLGERTNSGRDSGSRHSMLPRLASPLPAAAEEAQPAAQASPSFAENLPLPSPCGASWQQQPRGSACSPQQRPAEPDHKIKAAAAAAAVADVALSPVASGALAGQWTIGAAPADAQMADAPAAAAIEPAGSSAHQAAAKAAAALEQGFAAAQRSLDELSGGAGWGGGGGGAMALPPGLRDDVLAMHFDMLQQFQVGSSVGQALGMQRCRPTRNVRWLQVLLPRWLTRACCCRPFRPAALPAGAAGVHGPAGGPGAGAEPGAGG